MTLRRDKKLRFAGVILVVNVAFKRILIITKVNNQCAITVLDLVVYLVLQVGGGKSSFVLQMFRSLLREEGPMGLTKGLSARIIAMVPSSVAMVLGYETVKRLSLKTSEVDMRVQEEGYLEASF